MMPQSQGLMDDLESAPNFGEVFKDLAAMALYNRHFSWLFKPLLSLPWGIVRHFMSSPMQSFMDIETVR